jgi:hypothetical protein
MTPANLFISYSHTDEKFRNKLEKHLAALKNQGVLEIWHDRKIIAGQEWENEINGNLSNADIILLLISADFIASRYCYDIEMIRALERHNANEAIVIPIILRPADWHKMPFGKLQALPKDAKPVTKWQPQDEAFLSISQGIRIAVSQLRQKSQSNTTGPTLLGSSEIAVASMSNQETPAASCLEFLRLENINALWEDKPALFDASRVMTDGAGKRLGWDILTVDYSHLEKLDNILETFRDSTSKIQQEYNLEHHFLALVASGGRTAENENLAIAIQQYCEARNNSYQIRVYIGFMARNRFVDLVLTTA